jgi:uncharacterized GH25 family protein
VPNSENIAPLIVSVSASGGVLSGLVEDSGQGPVPGARVFLKHQNSERSWQNVQTRITDYTGRYEYAGLAPGKYQALALLETDEEHVDSTQQLRELDHGTVVEVPPYSNVSLSLRLSAN